MAFSGTFPSAPAGSSPRRPRLVEPAASSRTEPTFHGLSVALIQTIITGTVRSLKKHSSKPESDSAIRNLRLDSHRVRNAIQRFIQHENLLVKFDDDCEPWKTIIALIEMRTSAALRQYRYFTGLSFSWRRNGMDDDVTGLAKTADYLDKKRRLLDLIETQIGTITNTLDSSVRRKRPDPDVDSNPPASSTAILAAEASPSIGVDHLAGARDGDDRSNPLVRLLGAYLLCQSKMIDRRGLMMEYIEKRLHYLNKYRTLFEAHHQQQVVNVRAQYASQLRRLLEQQKLEQQRRENERVEKQRLEKDRLEKQHLKEHELEDHDQPDDQLWQDSKRRRRRFHWKRRPIPAFSPLSAGTDDNDGDLVEDVVGTDAPPADRHQPPSDHDWTGDEWDEMVYKPILADLERD